MRCDGIFYTEVGSSNFHQTCSFYIIPMRNTVAGEYMYGMETRLLSPLAELSRDELLCEIIYPFGRVTPWLVV